MVDLIEFYETFNLDRKIFGRIAHVSQKALDKYENEEKLRYKTQQKIERAVYLIEDYELECPKHKNKKDVLFVAYVEICEARFKEKEVY